VQLVECHADNAIRAIDGDHRAAVLDDLPEGRLHLFRCTWVFVHVYADRDAFLAHRLALHGQGVLDLIPAEDPEFDGASAIAAEADRHDSGTLPGRNRRT